MSLIILSILLLIVVFAVARGKKRAANLTSETDAEVVWAKTKQIGPVDKGHFETDVMFRYTAGGVVYHRLTTRIGRVESDFPPGRREKVRYNPDKPQDADVVIAE